jgi:phage host-nuclease inhibitor protein Gam
MAKRIKSDKQIETIADWQKADELIKQIGELQLKIKEHEAAASEVINDARAELAEAVEPLYKKITVLTDSLEAFAANHVEDFGKAQSRKLNFGLLGWRKSTSISIKAATLELVKKIFGKKAKAYIRTKEEVDKEAMSKLTDQQLASVDARRKPKEVFFVEPLLPDAVDYGA